MMGGLRVGDHRGGWLSWGRVLTELWSGMLGLMDREAELERLRWEIFK